MGERDRGLPPPETPGQRFGRLIRQGAEHMVALEDTKLDPGGEAHTRAKEGLAAVHDEFRQKCLHGNGYDKMLSALFEDRIVHRVLGVFQDRRDQRRAELLGEVVAERRRSIAKDWKLLRQEFPGQFDEPDYDRQAELGDVPPPTVSSHRFRAQPTIEQRAAAHSVQLLKEKEKKKREKKDDDEEDK